MELFLAGAIFTAFHLIPVARGSAAETARVVGAPRVDFSQVALRFFVNRLDLDQLGVADDSLPEPRPFWADDCGSAECLPRVESTPPARLSLAMLLRPTSSNRGRIVQPAPPSHRPSTCHRCRKGRILGGGDADVTQHPHLLQLALDGNQVCGASVISRRWAVTAAHCVASHKQRITLRAGATLRNKGGRIYRIEKKIVHPHYDNATYDYDIALLKVTKPFKFGTTVKPISLESYNKDAPSGQFATVCGWGTIEPDVVSPSKILQQLEVLVVGQEKCKAAYRAVNKKVTDRMLCANTPDGGDSCQGDSGGPLTINHTLIGIISWGKGCALPEYPGVYTRIAKFRKWIRSKIGV